MTNLDFEELDRAVQSAIDDLKKENTAKAETQKTEEPTFTPLAVPTKLPSAPAASPTPATVTKKVAAPKRPKGGVSRSLDSFSSPEANVNLTPTVKRQAKKVQSKRPSTPVIDIVTPVKKSTKNADLSTKQPAKPTDTKGIVTQQEPIFASQEMDEESLFLDPISLEAINESPFIKNLQVEKRPLGAFTTPLIDNLNKKDNKIKEEEQADSTEIFMAGGVDEPAQLPPELQADILAVETNGLVGSKKSEAIDSGTKASAAAKSGSAPKVNDALGEDDESTVTETLYTSEAYTKPLQHPAKQKTGWLRVVLIVLLMLVGIVGGVVIYYTMTA